MLVKTSEILWWCYCDEEKQLEQEALLYIVLTIKRGVAGQFLDFRFENVYITRLWRNETSTTMCT